MKIEFNGWKLGLYCLWAILMSPFIISLKIVVWQMLELPEFFWGSIIFYILVWKFIELVAKLYKFQNDLPSEVSEG